MFTPSAQQTPKLRFYFHLRERRENCRRAKRGLHNLVLRRGTQPALGQRLFQSRLLRTACQTDALARTELQSHAAGTGLISIDNVKNNAPQRVRAFPISPAALPPAVLPPPPTASAPLVPQPAPSLPLSPPQPLSIPTCPSPTSLLLRCLHHPGPCRTPHLPPHSPLPPSPGPSPLPHIPCPAPCSPLPAFPLLPLSMFIHIYTHTLHI